MKSARWMDPRLFLAGLLCSAAVGNSFGQGSGLQPRVPNTTLAFPSSLPQSGYTTTPAFGGLSFFKPVAMVTPPGETNRLFIVEQIGRISVITNLASPTRTLFLDISDRVQFQSEEGLLALAFHPGYETNRYFYVWYTTRSPRRDRLSRFEIDPQNPNRAIEETELIILNQLDEAENHNGGELLFGPDGYLYLSIGDEGGTPSNENVLRIDHDFFAGILRIDVDKRPGSIPPNPHPANSEAGVNYAIPPDNPFIGLTTFNGRPVDPAEVRTEFWAVGLRNPWRMSFDPETGFLYCADVGQKQREEVNIITRGGHYGWPYFEGTILAGFGGSPPEGFGPPLPPAQEYEQGSGAYEGMCIIGGFVYRGNRYADLYGKYLFADNVSGNIWSFTYEVVNGQTNIVPFTRIGSQVGISSFGIDPRNGDILVAIHWEDHIRRLVRAPDTPGSLPETLADTGAFSDLTNLTVHDGIAPYEINVPFWSDRAHKKRWFSVPDINLYLGFHETGNWSLPAGSVWIKHFDLELTNGIPASAKRIETRFLVRNESGVYGLTYRWGDSTENAMLVPESGMDESFVVNYSGVLRTQVWHYPSRTECLRCHTPQGGLALGFNTPQLNMDTLYEGSLTNQIAALKLAGYLTSNVSDFGSLPRLAHATNAAYSTEHRARSYFAANCVQCHQPGGSAQGLWDARITTPLNNAGIIDGPLIDYLGDANNRVIKGGSLSNSMIYRRVAALGEGHMPPLATSELNNEAITLLSRWIINDLVPNNPPNAGADTIYRYPSGGTRVLISALLANDSDPNGDTITFVSASPLSADGAAISREGDWIYYVHRAGLTDEDTFTYEITDGRSAPVTGIVNVLIDPGQVPSPNLQVTDLGNGSYRIRFDGVPDLTYRIEYTPTLNPLQWQTLGSETADANGLFEIIDTPPPGFGQRFYRSAYP